MAWNRRESASDRHGIGANRENIREDIREENPEEIRERREMFPVWTLIVLLGCALAWFGGWKMIQNEMAAYQAYAAIRQVVGGDTFFDGVTVDGIALGGLRMDEAQSLIGEQHQSVSQAFSLVVASGEKRWKITSNEVPVTFNAQAVLDRAYAIGRTGTLEERYAQIVDVAENGAAYQTGFSYDRSAINRLVGIIGDNLDVAAKDATLGAFDLNQRTFTFTEAKAGYRIDREKLATDILAALDAEAYDRVIVPQGEKVEPSVKKKDLEGCFGRISSFTTQTTKDKDRNTNIAISAEAINGRVVQPGEEMSFNSCTGQRTGAKGYREAGAIAGGVLVDDTGGGVCQTSSTLFNAVVRADMKIVSRSAHSWPSSYVNKGEDATVNYPSLDFVFRNESAYPIFIVAGYENQQVTVEVYGRLLDNGQSIDLESTVTKTIKPEQGTLYTLDPSLPVGTRKAGREKRTGYIVDTYKIYKDSEGQEISRKKLWTTTYRASQDEILYNDGSASKNN